MIYSLYLFLFSDNTLLHFLFKTDNSLQRRIQLGVAKKIKNGARKIILEKAEEARDAAFSAFKALGVDVPHFSLPKSTTPSVKESDSQHNTKLTTEEKPPQENSDDTTLSKSSANEVISTQKEHERADVGVGNKEKGPMSAVNIPGGFDSFLDMWGSTNEFFFDIHFIKRSEFHSIAPFELLGFAICWEDSPVYYISVPKDLFSSNTKRNKNPNNISSPEDELEMAKQRWSRVGMIMGKTQVRKFTWNLKIQNQVLKLPAVSIQKFGSVIQSKKTMELVNGSHYMFSPVHVKDAIDLCVVVWILWPDEERSSNPNLEKEVKKRLSSEVAASANQNGRWKNQMRRAAHNGCCKRAAQTRALSSVLLKLLTSEKLLEPLVTIEMPLVNVLSDMEVSGIGVDMEGCIQSRLVIGKKLRALESEAYKLAGTRFSLYTSADIADVLYNRLKLPVREGYKGKQHPSTDKHCLELLRYI